MFPNNARRRSIMDPTTVFCPNLACPARGQTGQGNIGIHARKDKRFLCTECDKTFSATKGTAFYRRHTAAETGTLVVTVLAHGCPPQAMVAAFGLDERTVLRWLARGGGHGQAVQEQLVEQPRDLGQVQADELRGKQQGGMVWMALAMMVRTRLGLAGEVREHRDMALIRGLMERVRRCALPRPLLVCTDGLRAYVRAVRETFRAPVHAGAQGRPRLRPWRHLCIAQVVKRYAQRCVVDVERRLVEGTPARVETLRRRSQGAGVINTAYIERLHATFRERLASLTRRGRALARHTLTLRHGMYLIATIDNFCTPHESLRDAHPAVGVAGVARTPARAAGITNHCWTVQELLSLHVPPSRWTPPKQRGRPSRALKRLVERWCS
jgi:transposase-like protein/IS1 family transposase